MRQMFMMGQPIWQQELFEVALLPSPFSRPTFRSCNANVKKNKWIFLHCFPLLAVTAGTSFCNNGIQLFARSTKSHLHVYSHHKGFVRFWVFLRGENGRSSVPGTAEDSARTSLCFIVGRMKFNSLHKKGSGCIVSVGIVSYTEFL